jgi:hypothetical protein
LITTFYQIGPDANSLVGIISKTGRTFVLGGFAVPAAVESAAVRVVREDTVQTRAVRSGNWWFCSRSINKVVRISEGFERGGRSVK